MKKIQDSGVPKTIGPGTNKLWGRPRLRGATKPGKKNRNVAWMDVVYPPVQGNQKAPCITGKQPREGEEA